MNIQNIASLVRMLKKVGFRESMGRQLVQHICLKLPDFILIEQMSKETDQLFCSVFFQQQGDEYRCTYYDVSLLKDIELPDTHIQTIDIKNLDFRMSQIDWLFQDKVSKLLDLSDESTWQEEINIERILTELAQLSLSQEGKYFAESLKLKYWSCCARKPFAANLNVFRSRYEIAQRFYFIEEQCISIEDAYRFLINRWTEKQQNLRRRQIYNSDQKGVSHENTSDARPVLPKNRRNKRKKIKE